MSNNFSMIHLSKTVKERLDKAKGDASATAFISYLLDNYEKQELFIEKCDEAIEELRIVKQQNNTNLGLLCETLRKLGVINDDGIVIATIED